MRYLFLLTTTLLYGNIEFLDLVETTHELILDDLNGPMTYEAVTGKFPVNSDSDEEMPPEIFFIAYLKTEGKNRPITFIFPGGPGGSSGPETICTFGPRRILLPSEGKPLLPPYELIDNPETLLPWTDLVFVDPIGTGFSTGNNHPEEIRHLLSVDGDIVCLGDFVRSFIAYFNRWNSPKYLSGTSYGTTRCCGLADYLMCHDFSVHGIILLGAALDYSTLISQHNRTLPDSLLLPTFAATAWYHGRLWPERTLDEVVDYARLFSFNRYIPAALQPHRLSPTEQETLYQDIATLIGLPLETVRRYQGRFDEFLYTTEFFGPERKVIGGLDTRYIGDLHATHRKDNSDDPSYNDMQGLNCAFNAYLHNELETSHPFDKYITFSSTANALWNYSTHDSVEWPEMMQRIRRTLVRNPEMKIFVGSGYYDCRTPFAATEYCFAHLNLPASYQSNLQFAYYNGGHGFIFDHNCLKKLKSDLETFYTQTTKMQI